MTKARDLADNTQNTKPKVVDAKGDLIAATAADTASRLAVGANNTVLTADSAEATGLKWATPSSGGMTVLASGSLPTGAAVLTLSSISGSYKNLQLIIRDPYPVGSFKLNNDSSANRYSQAGVNMVNTASAVQGDLTTTIYGAWNGLLTTSQSNVQIFNIYDYANTSSFKVFDVMSMGITTASAVALWASNGAYRSASAVNRIDYTADSNFGGGTYILYGVN